MSAFLGPSLAGDVLVVSVGKAYKLLAVSKGSHTPKARSTAAVSDAAASMSGMTAPLRGTPREAQTAVAWSYLN